LADPSVALIVLGAIAGGLVQGLSGFAFGLIAMAFWAWAVPPQLAGPMVVFGSLLGQLLALPTIRPTLGLGLAVPFILGGVIGVPLGALLLPYVDQHTFKTSIGVLLTLWSLGMLLARELPRISRGGRLADGVAGLIGGAMGGLAGLSGPAPILWCTLRGWDRDIQRAVFQSFNLCMAALTMTIYLGFGLIGREALHVFALIAPALLIPTLLGARLYRNFSVYAFRQLVLVLLLLSGIMLLVGSQPALLEHWFAGGG
jgi:uncharacterized membrane protein YfcA